MDSYMNLSHYLLKECKSFFDKYNFEPIVDKGNELIVGNNYCSLRFIVDEKLDYAINYEAKAINYPFGLFQIIRFLKPDEANSSFDTPSYKNIIDRREITHSTKLDLEFVDRYIPNILTGDTSWSNKLINDLEYQKKLVEFVFNKLPNGHPIKEQFWGGDIAWRTNLENYLKDNNISVIKPTVTLKAKKTNTKAWWRFW